MKFVKQLVSVIRQMLPHLKDQGYDRIVISGGTSLDLEHYSGVIGYEYDHSSKEFFFVGLPYNSKYHLENDESSNTKKPGETPIATGIREFFEETGLKAKPEDLVPILNYSIKDKRPGMENKLHHKNFYMIDIKKCSGELYTFEGPNPIDGETAAPILMPASLFYEVLFGGHKQALDKAIEKLSINREYAYSLMSLIH